MDGYAAAFRDAGIRSNILGGTNGGIEVNVVFFATSATEGVGYTLLDRVTAINDFADLLDTFARPDSSVVGSGTNIYTGTNLAVSLLTGVGAPDTTNYVIDVSGDGTDSQSLNETARDAAALAGITVNGLAIENSVGSTTITDFYNNYVVTSDGFVVTASGFGDFAGAVRTKLDIETGGGVPVPGTLLLLGLGLAGLGLRKRTG